MPDPRLSETTSVLLDRVRVGDESALEALIARFLPRLRRWAAGRLPRTSRAVLETDDIVQDTVIKALRHLQSFQNRGEGALAAYLRQAVMNRLNDSYRQAKRAAPVEGVSSDIVAREASPLEEAIGAEALADYEAALARLSPLDREAVLLRLEFGCSYDEIAMELGKPTADAARVAVSRAVARLAREFHAGR
jgi:RNA polymerase sigma-70 factor (ECF subfamily)